MITAGLNEKAGGATDRNDPSGRLSAGGPATLTGTLASTIKDAFGNTASTSAFTIANVRLF